MLGEYCEAPLKQNILGGWWVKLGKKSCIRGGGLVCLFHVSCFSVSCFNFLTVEIHLKTTNRNTKLLDSQLVLIGMVYSGVLY